MHEKVSVTQALVISCKEFEKLCVKFEKLHMKLIRLLKKVQCYA